MKQTIVKKNILGILRVPYLSKFGAGDSRWVQPWNGWKILQIIAEQQVLAGVDGMHERWCDISNLQNSIGI